MTQCNALYDCNQVVGACHEVGPNMASLFRKLWRRLLKHQVPWPTLHQCLGFYKFCNFQRNVHQAKQGIESACLAHHFQSFAWLLVQISMLKDWGQQLAENMLCIFSVNCFTTWLQALTENGWGAKASSAPPGRSEHASRDRRDRRPSERKRRRSRERTTGRRRRSLSWLMCKPMRLIHAWTVHAIHLKIMNGPIDGSVCSSARGKHVQMCQATEPWHSGSRFKPKSSAGQKDIVLSASLNLCDLKRVGHWTCQAAWWSASLPNASCHHLLCRLM